MPAGWRLEAKIRANSRPKTQKALPQQIRIVFRLQSVNNRVLSDVLGSVRIRPTSDALVVSMVQVNVVRRNHHQPIDLGGNGRLRARAAASAESLCNTLI